MDRTKHWEDVYSQRLARDLGWYQVTPVLSLEWINRCCDSLDQGIIDVGGGASNLVDHLLAAGFKDLTVLDVSGNALEAVRARLGNNAEKVQWIVTDVTRFKPERAYCLWHDRAVFHFLTEAQDRAAYVAALEAALEPGGHAIIATFAEDGPTECSHLPVYRYSAQSLAKALGGGFTLVEARHEEHVTPAERVQNFVYCRFQRVMR